VTCPGCAQDVVPLPITFTWWGGFFGPKMLAHVQCPHCSARFNGRTGGSNEQAIRIYMFVALVLTVIFVIAIMSTIS
jgi:hypothetical protein